MHAEHNESVLRAEGADVRAPDGNIDEPLSKSVEIGAHRKMPHGEFGMQLEPVSYTHLYGRSTMSGIITRAEGNSKTSAYII